MKFDWDAGNIKHIALHGITPPQAEQVLQNRPLKMNVEFRNGEWRTLYLGETDAGLVVFVTSTDRNGMIRVVTAYPAKRKMRVFYFTQKGASHE